jgi:fatty acid desaturase
MPPLLPPALLADLQRLIPGATVLVALADHVAIVATGFGWLWLWSSQPPGFAIPGGVCLLVLAARTQRGLECLVHDASHYNWTRRKTANDTLANLLAAVPVMSWVANYRRTHRLHHSQLGGASDTDLVRWNELDIASIRGRGRRRYLIGVLRRVVSYVPGWWWAIGLDRLTVLRALLWHLALLAVLSVATDVGTAVVVLGLGWLVPFVFVLPVIRFLGELEEHNYFAVGGASKVGMTNTNVGVVHRLILHPHADGYHTAHHLVPSVPFYKVRRLHRALCEFRGDYSSEVPVWRAVLR